MLVAHGVAFSRPNKAIMDVTMSMCSKSYLCYVVDKLSVCLHA